MKINWGNAVSGWDGLTPLDEELPLDDEVQRMLLSEDMAQLHYPTGKLVDVGWYCHADDDGHSFAVFVIDKGGWYDPLWHKRAATLSELREVIQAAIEIANKP